MKIKLINLIRMTLIITMSILILNPIKSIKASDSVSSLEAQQQQTLEQLRNAQKAADEKMKEAQNLKDEIAVLDASVAQIEAAIAQTNYNISVTEGEIAKIKQQITEKETELATQKSNLYETMRVVYETPNESTVEIVVGSNSLSEIVDRAQYIESLQYQIESTIESIKKLKSELETQRNELEKKRAELADFRSQQLVQKKGLDEQKSQKAVVLESTITSQKSFETIVEDSKKALDKLDAQIAALTGSHRISYGHVNQGDIIGHQGGAPGACGAGYSTGSHLHFGVKVNGTWVNPRSNISSAFSWPFTGFRVTQEFGPANWTWWYINNFHSGIDLVSDNGYGAPVRAAASGDIVINQNDGSFGYGNHIVIDHGHGILTLYAHLICE